MRGKLFKIYSLPPHVPFYLRAGRYRALRFFKNTRRLIQPIKFEQHQGNALGHFKISIKLN